MAQIKRGGTFLDQVPENCDSVMRGKRSRTKGACWCEKADDDDLQDCLALGAYGGQYLFVVTAWRWRGLECRPRKRSAFK